MVKRLNYSSQMPSAWHRYRHLIFKAFIAVLIAASVGVGIGQAKQFMRHSRFRELVSKLQSHQGKPFSGTAVDEVDVFTGRGGYYGDLIDINGANDRFLRRSLVVDELKPYCPSSLAFQYRSAILWMSVDRTPDSMVVYCLYIVYEEVKKGRRNGHFSGEKFVVDLTNASIRVERTGAFLYEPLQMPGAVVVVASESEEQGVIDVEVRGASETRVQKVRLRDCVYW